MCVYGRNLFGLEIPPSFTGRSFVVLLRTKPLFRGGSVSVGFKDTFMTDAGGVGYLNHVASCLCCPGMQRFMSDGPFGLSRI